MDFLVEYGVEELPAKQCAGAYKQLKNSVVPSLLSKYGIKFSEFKVMMTPRRIALTITDIDLAPEEKYIRGPRADLVFTAGRFNDKAKVFAHETATALRKLKRVTADGVEYIAAVNDVKKALGERLQSLCIDLVEQVSFKSRMIWDNSGVEFIRPIRWIAAVIDTVPLSFSYADVVSSSLSYGARFSGGTKVRIRSPRDYERLLKTYEVIADPDERKQMILDQIADIEKRKHIKVNVDDTLLDEIVYLVECPVVVMGKIDKEFMELPAEVITEVLSHHQKSFSVSSQTGQLEPYFIAVINQFSKNAEKVTEGWEKVVRARLADALFYYRKDEATDTSAFEEKARQIIVHEKYGSVNDLTQTLIKNVDLVKKFSTASEIATLKKMMQYVNFDLGTNLVTEFPKLHGDVGRVYLVKRKLLDAKTASYLPEVVNYTENSSKVGALGALIVAMSYLSVYLNAGFKIEGNYDPYGLRRYTNQLISVILGSKLDLTLTDLMKVSVGGATLFNKEASSYFQVLLIGRLETRWKEMGIDKNLIKKGLAEIEEGYSFVKQTEQFMELTDLEKEDAKWYVELKEVNKRVQNVVDQAAQKGIKPAAVTASGLSNKHTKALFSAIDDVEKKLKGLKSDAKVSARLKEIARLNSLVNNFFDNVMVLDKDKKVASINLGVLEKYLEIAQK